MFVSCVLVETLYSVILLCGHINPAVLHQVRVFIHSTNGQVMEQDLSTVGHEPLPLLEESIGGMANEEAGPHDHTTNKSVAMDLTGVESVPSEPNLAAFQQVCVCVCDIVILSCITMQLQGLIEDSACEWSM